MKKIISAILCIVLILTGVCSCGNNDAPSDTVSGSSPTSSSPSSSAPDSSTPSSSAPSSSSPTSSATSSTVSLPADVVKNAYKITFPKATQGNIIHANATDYSFGASSDFESFDNFYIYLPEGSKIYCTEKFVVYCYNNSFELDTAITGNCGQTLITFSPVYSTSVRTLNKGCYVRLSVMGKLSSIVINVPKDKQSQVIYGEKEDLLYAPYISEVKTNLSGKGSNVNYLFVTDLHYNGQPTSGKGRLLFKQVNAIVKIANTVDSIDFVVIGGDTTDGNYVSKAESLKYTAEILEPFKNCKKPVLVLSGNHDDNSYHYSKLDQFVDEQIVSDKDWTDKVLKVYSKGIVKDSKHKDSKYYYYDIKGKKTRVICLDAVDYRAQYDSKGVIKELPIQNASALVENNKYSAGNNYWGYSEAQMKWLADEAMTAPKDWDYMFVSHVGIDRNTMSNGYDTKFGSTLRGIIGAYQSRKSYSSGSISVDFASVTGKVLAYQYGHTHTNRTTYSKDINLWQVNTASAQFECFDIVSASDKVVYKYPVGEGDNVVMKYD